MANPSIPNIQLTEDDNFVTVELDDTTLVLSSSTYALTSGKCNFPTKRLIVYADAISLGSNLEMPGKDVHLHCNEIFFQDGAQSQISVKGADGKKEPGDTNEPIDGQNGGSITLNIHNRPFVLKESKEASIWPDTAKFDLGAGAAGSKMKPPSTEPELGKDGQPGQLQVIYSNPLLRAVSEMMQIVGSDIPVAAKVANLSAGPVPAVVAECEKLKILPSECQNLQHLVDEYSKLGVLIGKCREQARGFAEYEFGQVGDEAVENMENLRQRTDFPPNYDNINEALNDVFEAASKLVKLSQTAGTTAERDADIDYLQSMLKKFSDTIESKPSSETEASDAERSPLSFAANEILHAIEQLDESARKDMQAKINPSTASLKVTSTALAQLSQVHLNLGVPLAHPDQCQMMLKLADAAYFSGETNPATALYRNLLERLFFVPDLLRDKNKNQQDGTQPSPLVQAYTALENAHRLSNWTFPTLNNVFVQAAARLKQLHIGLDLFGHAPGWAPRLSYDFFSEYAVRQIESLSRYEASYWTFFRNFQAQTEAGATLREALAVNIHRAKQYQDDIDAAWSTLKVQSKIIEQSAKDLVPKREKLAKDLKTVSDLIDTWHLTSMGSFCSLIESVVVIGIGVAAVAAAPIGLALGATALVFQGAKTFDDVTTNLTNAYGERVNKAYVLQQLETCSDNLKSLVNTGYKVQPDGSMLVDADDTRKIAVTKVQLDKFVEEFKGRFPNDKKESLSESLDSFVKAASERNQHILLYNAAVTSLYRASNDRELTQMQAGDISAQLIKENNGLASIVAYYQKLRSDGKFGILRTIGSGAAALRFSGLMDGTKFPRLGFLSTMDELTAHVDVLLKEHQEFLYRFGAFAQSVWPSKRGQPDRIMHKLSGDEIKALKVPQPDPVTSSDIHTVTVNGLGVPVTRNTKKTESPFAGKSNVRISQVRFWALGISLDKDVPSLSVDIKHSGTETIVSPNGDAIVFAHDPVQMTFEYRWETVRQKEDIRESHVTSEQILATDLTPMSATSKVQSPIGPFATWTITIDAALNPGLNLAGLQDAYLEFCGTSFPFQR